MPQMLVVGAAVDPKHPTQDGDGVLAGQGLNGIQSLSECGVKIAIAFFKMRFSSSSSALRFCSALICWAERIVSSSTFTWEYFLTQLDSADEDTPYSF